MGMNIPVGLLDQSGAFGTVVNYTALPGTTTGNVTVDTTNTVFAKAKGAGYALFELFIDVNGAGPGDVVDCSVVDTTSANGSVLSLDPLGGPSGTHIDARIFVKVIAGKFVYSVNALLLTAGNAVFKLDLLGWIYNMPEV